MLQFRLEWEDEPRVRDRLQRATWARIEIHASGAAGKVCLTDCVGLRSGSLREGVYGSALPIATWVVQNWWALLCEAVLTDRFRGGRVLAGDASLRPWIQRHNLLAARSGFALPDLTLYRDGAYSVLRCVPDPPEPNSLYPVRFVADAEVRAPLTQTEEGLHALVAPSRNACGSGVRRTTQRQKSFCETGRPFSRRRGPNARFAKRPPPWDLTPMTLMS